MFQHLQGFSYNCSYVRRLSNIGSFLAQERFVSDVGRHVAEVLSFLRCVSIFFLSILSSSPRSSIHGQAAWERADRAFSYRRREGLRRGGEVQFFYTENFQGGGGYIL